MPSSIPRALSLTGNPARPNAFHRTALANGGNDAGALGLRPDYDTAFVRDPDGNKIEAVSFAAQ